MTHQRQQLIMPPSIIVRILVAAVALAIAVPVPAAGDPRRGAQLFRQCLACHSTEPGQHLTGPSLARVWNREAASVEGFTRYSDALRNAHLVWNDENLERWLADPERFVPGTTMTFPGLKQPRDRQDVVAYLKALAGNTAPPAARGGGGMMGMGGPKADLRKAPPSGLVKSMRHCGDTYTIETADGKTHKVWEFNLRFKTDSSKLGPLPDNPVVVGAGMQGDRASVVFASPKEISSFIKLACP